MASDGLPPSVNWYSSRASDISQDSVLAYASRNAIVLLKVNLEGQTLYGFLHGHEQRVVSVAFNKTEAHLLATCGDDGRVKLWNVKSKTFIKEHGCHEGKVTSLDWSPISKDVLVSGDDKGNIVFWSHGDGESRQWLPEKDGVSCLACAYSGAVNVAVGYNSGQILILELGHKKDIILHRLRGHDDVVQSICWSPSPWQSSETTNMGHADKQPREGHALLSGGKDQTIRLWSPSEETMIQAFKIPSQSGRRSRYRGDEGTAKGRVWVTIWWPNNHPNQFVSSSFGGEIVLWNLDKSGKQKWVTLGQESYDVHSRPVFSILPVGTNHFLTSSMDRQMILWDLVKGTVCWKVATLGGFVYQLRISPQDDATMAVGVGDNMIRIWNTNSRGSTSRVVTLWQGLKSKVSAVCWHPEREGVLAFGTDDGRVGLFVAINPNKSPILSGTFHKKTVYSLSFGPKCCKTNELNPEDAEKICLFSCGGEGLIYQHHATNMSEEAISIDVIIRDTNSIQHMLPLRSEVSWRADRKVVAVGNDDGSIEVYSAPHLLMLCTIQIHHKIINCLEWFPVQQCPEGQRSILEFCLASGSNETVVYVHDLSAVLRGESYCPTPVPISTAFRTLSGHMFRITSLQWNPHSDGRLVSVSYDGTAQVWNVIAGEGVANFRGHYGRLLSVAWSHLNPDIVFTGGEDFCLMKWKISECSHSHPPKDKKEINVKFYNFNQSNRDGKKKKANNKMSSVFSKIPSNSSQAEVSLDVKNEKGETQTSKNITSVQLPEKDLVSITELLEKKKQEFMQTEEKKEAAKDDGIALRDRETQETGAVVKAVRKPLKSEESVTTIEGGREESAIAIKGVSEDSTTATERAREDSAPATEIVEDAPRNVGRGKRKRGKSMFPISSRLDNRGKQFYLTDCMEIARRKYGGESEEDAMSQLQEESIHLGLFCSRRDAFQTLTSEGQYHQNHGNHDFKMWLTLWQGRVLQTIREATHKGQLTDKLVAMAPQAGHEVWLETCHAYARQLENSGDAQSAASYYLCCHRVYDAIRTLKDHKHFREAASLAVARLPHSDPVFLDVYQCWAAELESEHCFGQAARCYLAIEKPENAVRLLARIGSQTSLKVALEIALLTNQKDILPSLVPRYANECMLNQDWSDPWEVASGEAAVMALHLVVLIHEALTLSQNNLSYTADPTKEPKYSLNLSEIGLEGYDEFSKWMCSSLRGRPILSEVLSIWEDRNSKYMGQVSKQDVLQTVMRLFLPNFDSKIPSQFHISVAICLTLHLLQEATKETSQRSNEHIERILKECLQQGDIHLMITILSLVFPSGCLKDKLCAGDTSTTPQAGLVETYYAYAVLYHMWWNFPALQQPSQTCSLRTSTKPEGQTEPSVFENASDNKLQRTEDLSQTVTLNGTDVESSLVSVKDSSSHEIDFREYCKHALRELEICKEILINRESLKWYEVRAELEHIKQKKKILQLSSNDRTDSDVVAETEAGGDGSKVEAIDGGAVDVNDLLGNREHLRSPAEGGDINSQSIQTESESSELVSQRTVGGDGDCIGYQELNNSLHSMKNDTLLCKGGEGSWEKMPVFERYHHSSVTMEIILKTEIRIQEEWKHLNMVSLCPDPVEAALIITSILTDIILSGYEEPVCWSMLQNLLEWGLDHSYMKNQQRHFLSVMEKVKHCGK